MAGGSHIIWVPLLLSCVFQVRSVSGYPDGIPITLPDGIDPKNINVTTITIKTCTGAHDQLTLLDKQLKEATFQTRQLDIEASALRRKVSFYEVQLAQCSSTTPAVSDCYRTELQNKLKRLLDTFENDQFLILKFLQLTSEVNTLQNKIKRATINSTETPAAAILLQKELQEKRNELDVKKQQVERSNTNSALIFEIILLQTEIWDLGQDSNTGESGETTERRIKALQEQLNKKLKELQGRKDATSDTLELISMSSKIVVIERLLNVYTTESKTSVADYLKQWKKISELLTQKISLLIEKEEDQQLTQEILDLQMKLERLRQLIANTRTTTESQLQELRRIWELEKKQQALLQKKMEESNFAQAQTIIKIISLMKELRETQIEETSSSRETTQTLTERYNKAQAEIKELQQKLKSKTEECSGLREGYAKLKTEFDLKIAELHRTGESKTALILNVINLQNEISALRDLIFVTEDSGKVKELQKQLEEKQEQLRLQNAQIEKLIANPRTVLTIIQLQNEIRNFQKIPANKTTIDHIEALQFRLDGLIREIDSKDGNTQLVLQILTLQNQVENFQRQLSDLDKLHISEVTKLRNDLTSKKNELHEYVNELIERNSTNARLILEISDLHSQLSKLEEKGRNDNTTYSLTIYQLQEELNLKTLQCDRDRAEIKKLQQELQIRTEECSEPQDRYNKTQTDLEQLIEELKIRGESKASLILKVINLHGELKTLIDLISKTKPENLDNLSALQRQLEEKQDELNAKNAELEQLVANSRLILKIIHVQNEIWDLQRKNTSGTTRKQVEALQNTLNVHISEINTKADENVKLVLQIISLQSQVEQLQELLSNLTVLTRTEVTQITNELVTKKKLLQKYTSDLNKSNQTNARLVLKIIDLNNQLRNMKRENQERSNGTSTTIFKLREQLKRKELEHFQYEATIKALQDKLNQTGSQCYSLEQQLEALRTELDRKIQELLSKSNSVTSLALQISTLTLQLEESKRQLKNTESPTKLTELQKIIDEKSKELAEKTEELQKRSPQAQRLLHIVVIQKEIEKYVAANETNYDMIKALEDRLATLVEGIQDEENENLKLTFKILSQQDEINRLKKLEGAQEKAYSVKIAGLENELGDIRNQIKEKSDMLNKGDKRVNELSSQILNLHKKIKPLEEEIEDLKATNAAILNDMRKRLSLKEKQLQDNELQLKEANEQNFQFIMEISDLKGQLKKTEKHKLKIKDLEETVEKQEKQIQKLESTNRDLKKELNDLHISCSNNGRNDCEDIQTQLQLSMDEVSRQQKQLQSKDAKLKQLQEELEEQTRMTNRVRQEYDNLEKQLQQSQALNDHLQKQLSDKDAVINQQQKELEERTADYYKLQGDYNKLQTEKSKLEETVEELQNKIADKEDRTIYPRKITFDPNTAHPRIRLSQDNTKMSTAEEMQNVLDHPGRFDVDLAALGSTGYSSGRQYWEVSVAGKTCYHIGMTSETAQRKGQITYKPAQGYWTIIRNKQGQLRALDNRPVVIRIQEQPLRLGIVLDYKNGQISFYDAGTRAHMYSFAGQRFTDKIYPFVNFCVEDVENLTPIALLTPGSVDWIK